MKRDWHAVRRMATELMQADGHCLYRAVGDQLGSHTNSTAQASDLWAIRAKAAAYMRAHPDQFVPFMPEATSSFAWAHLNCHTSAFEGLNSVHAAYLQLW